MGISVLFGVLLLPGMLFLCARRNKAEREKGARALLARTSDGCALECASCVCVRVCVCVPAGRVRASERAHAFVSVCSLWTYLVWPLHMLNGNATGIGVRALSTFKPSDQGECCGEGGSRGVGGRSFGQDSR
jgi:hypothetical protein